MISCITEPQIQQVLRSRIYYAFSTISHHQLSRDTVFESDFLRDIPEVAVHLGGEDGANATGTQREMQVGIYNKSCKDKRR